MSDDNKKFSDELDDLLGDAKEGVKKAADKAEDFARKAADKAEDFAKEAKEKGSEFAKEAKAKAEEYTDDAKEVLSDGKNVAIIAHLTLIGWIIAIIMNSNNKSEFASFYIRQVLGLFLIGFIGGIIPVVNIIVGIVVFILWLISLIGAIGGKQKPIPILGTQFQDWFKSL